MRIDEFQELYNEESQLAERYGLQGARKMFALFAIHPACFRETPAANQP
jgi:hypothetical protein